MRARFILLALQQRCHADGEWRMRRGGRLRSTLKFIFCVLLLPEGKTYCAHPLESVVVAVFDGHSWNTPNGEGSTWSLVAVGRGWRNWRWELTSDGW